MFKPGRETIIIDGVKLEVPEEIRKVLPTTSSGMKDVNVYDTGNCATYKILEPLMYEIMAGFDGGHISKNMSAWSYYIEFLHKYIPHSSTAGVNPSRRRDIINDCRIEFNRYLGNVLKLATRKKHVVSYSPSDSRVININSDGWVTVNLIREGCIYVEAIAGLSVIELFNDFLSSYDQYDEKEFDILGISFKDIIGNESNKKGHKKVVELSDEDEEEEEK